MVGLFSSLPKHDINGRDQSINKRLFLSLEIKNHVIPSESFVAHF